MLDNGQVGSFRLFWREIRNSCLIINKLRTRSSLKRGIDPQRFFMIRYSDGKKVRSRIILIVASVVCRGLSFLSRMLSPLSHAIKAERGRHGEMVTSKVMFLQILRQYTRSLVPPNDIFDIIQQISVVVDIRP